jgi:serine/threonine protein kinase/HD-like signal output (HDOD) protein
VTQELRCAKCEAVNSPNLKFCESCGDPLPAAVAGDGQVDPIIGHLVGNRFVVLERIAQGGMGVVYRAEQTGIWRPVALKVLRSKLSRDPNLLERFRNEASLASKLTHPNTITVYDFGLIEDNGLYIAMEFVEGTDISREIERHGALGWPRVSRIAMQICGSLQDAHDHGIVHRDLKPENIMLTRRGLDTDVVKVLDFGIAKIMGNKDEEARPALTSGNQVFGTPEYMSPEQIRGDALDPGADIYALGVILYKMLSGRLPFEAPTSLALLAKHLSEAPAPLRAGFSCPSLPLELTLLVETMLAKDRDNRPQSMRAVSLALRSVLKFASRESTLAPTSRPAPSRNVPPPLPSSTRNLRSDSIEDLPTLGPSSAWDAPLEKEDEPDILSETPLEQTKPDRPSKLRPLLSPEPTPVKSITLADGLIPPYRLAQSTVEARTALPPQSRENLAFEGALQALEAELSVSAKTDGAHKEDSSPGLAKTELKGPGRREEFLHELIEAMRKKRDFPAMAAHITELKSKTGREDVSARQLATIILKDYGLTSKLLRLVNSPFYGSHRGRVATVSRAVVIMGFEEVRQMAMGLMMFEQAPHEDMDQARHLLESSVRSMASGIVARSVAKQLGVAEEEEAFVCSMFHDLGKLLTGYYFPARAKEITRLIRTKEHTEASAAMKVLGLSYEELGQIVARRWDLPDQIPRAMSALPKGKVPKSTSRQAKLRDIAGLSNELVDIISRDAPLERKKALQRFAHRFEDSLKITEKQLDAVLAESTKEIVETSRSMPVPTGRGSFLRQLVRWTGLENLLPPPKEKEVIDLKSFLPPDVAPLPSAEEKSEQESILVQGVEEIEHALSASTYDFNSLVLMIVETMYRGLGLSRVLLCINDPRTGVMSARTGLGDGVEAMIPLFRFRPRRATDAFNTALSRGADIILDNSSGKGFEEKLPEWYRQFQAPQAVVLLPIMLKSFPIALLYGDALTPGTTIDRALLAHLDKLRAQAARALSEKRA